MEWIVYIIEAENGKLYTGITTQLERRLREHAGQGKRRGASFFRFSPPKRVLYQEVCAGRSLALKREREIKSFSRAKKKQLIGEYRQTQVNPT